MKRLIVLALTFLVLGVACVPAETSPPKLDARDRAFARASVIQMGFAVTAAGTQCSNHAQWLAAHGKEQVENATRLFNLCVNRLGPARDAVVFSIDDIDPWTEKSAAIVGCTGKSVRLALETLRADFVTWRVKEPALMSDGIQVGAWAERFATPDCDPLHPTTKVEMFEDPAIPRVEPGYPPSPTTITFHPIGAWVGSRI